MTGSGKTLAFLIPIVERLLKLEDQVPKHHVGVIIISPTRSVRHIESPAGTSTEVVVSGNSQHKSTQSFFNS